MISSPERCSTSFADSDSDSGSLVGSTVSILAAGSVSGMLFVTEYSYVDGEEHDAKLLYSGTPIKSSDFPAVLSDSFNLEIFRLRLPEPLSLFRFLVDAFRPSVK